MAKRTEKDIAGLLASGAFSADAENLVAGARKLYPDMSPSPTDHGYWHIRTRSSFSVPYFLESERRKAQARAANGFCAIYYSTRGRRSGKPDSGKPTALFIGKYTDETYDIVDRCFRVITSEVMESGLKLNRKKGRILGGLTGCAVGVALPSLGLLFLLRNPELLEKAPWPAGMLPHYQISAILAASIVIIAAASSILGELGLWLGGRFGAFRQEKRLRKMDHRTRGFLYGNEATDHLMKEYELVSREEAMEREYRKYEAHSISMTRKDFARVYGALPFIKQLAVTEHQRREEMATIENKIGGLPPVDFMRLVEPYLQEL
jgi:hypothetical protein